MKRTYNYITIVKEGHDLKLGKNCGMSCNRRNTMDKAHGRKGQIIAAVNLLGSDKDGVDECIEFAQILSDAYKNCLIIEPLEATLHFLAGIALRYHYADKCEIYTTEPVKWSY